MSTYAIAVGLADVHRDPDQTSELVTQALMHMPVELGEVSGDWTFVTLADYAGWVQTCELAETAYIETDALSQDQVAVVMKPYSPLFAAMHGDQEMDTVYLSTLLPLLNCSHGERYQVALPGKRSAWIERDAIALRQRAEPYPHASLNVVTDYARMFVDVPYLWGGTSWKGIDCSGFVQVCYRMGGQIIPRDADQQHDALPQSVTREQMVAGDLIFFGKTAITHVGMALNQEEYIHAEGRRYNRVIVNSFDPQAPHYDNILDDLVWAIKRVVA